MTKQLKELLQTAPHVKAGTYTSIMFVSNGLYNGFYGKNGYDSMIILGYSLDTSQWEIISEYGDIFMIYEAHKCFNVDIPHEYGIPRMWFSSPICINNDLELSSVTGELEN